MMILEHSRYWRRGDALTFFVLHTHLLKNLDDDVG